MVSARICGGLSIERGSVDTGLSVEGVIANYTCDTGYRLTGNVKRVCQSSGLWNGTDPTCQGAFVIILATKESTRGWGIHTKLIPA